MARTVQQIKAQRAQLLDRHPALAEVQLRSLPQTDLDWEAIAAFICPCWKREYEWEPRVAYTAEALAYYFGRPESCASSVAVFSKGRLASIVLAKDLCLCEEKDSPLLRGQVTTGVSTDPAYWGKGYHQLAALAHFERQIALGYDFALAWIDVTHNRAGSTFQTYTSEKSPAEAGVASQIMAKALDIPQLNALGLLKRRYRMAAPLLNRFFPSRIVSLPRGYQIEACAPGCEQACSDFLMASQAQQPWKTWISPEEFLHRITFRQPPVQGKGYLLRQAGEIKGLAYGYTNPIPGEAAYFSMDAFMVDDSVGHRVKRQFLAHVEARVHQELACCAILIPRTAVCGGLSCCGYHSVAKHLLLGMSYSNEFVMSEAFLQNLFLEVR